ncbi:MAG: sigma-54-dependent transcriptional regulator, partial [Spirochaetota bacterium]
MNQENPGKILIVDDDENVIDVLTLMLRSAGYDNILTCSNPLFAADLIACNNIDCMILDLTMPGLGGEAILSETAAAYPDIPIIILTSTIDIDTVVRCMKAGASDYLTKPIEREKLNASVSRLLTIRSLQKENIFLRNRILNGDILNPDLFSAIITSDEKMFSIFRYVESVAASNHSFLIAGETGTGKELFAKVIHEGSGRKGKFVTVNAAGLDDTVFTDTMFGHKKGAYTSADSVRSGLVKEAEGGTLFLDEIGDLSKGPIRPPDLVFIARNLMVLAKLAAQVAVAEKDVADACCAADHRFLA